MEQGRERKQRECRIAEGIVLELVSFRIRQFFADNYKSEPGIITSFLEILGNYKYLYHFNGKTFDIPYILNKCSKYGIKPDSHCLSVFSDTDSIYSIDLLVLVRK